MLASKHDLLNNPIDVFIKDAFCRPAYVNELATADKDSHHTNALTVPLQQPSQLPQHAAERFHDRLLLP